MLIVSKAEIAHLELEQHTMTASVWTNSRSLNGHVVTKIDLFALMLSREGLVKSTLGKDGQAKIVENNMK